MKLVKLAAAALGLGLLAGCSQYYPLSQPDVLLVSNGAQTQNITDNNGNVTGVALIGLTFGFVTQPRSVGGVISAITIKVNGVEQSIAGPRFPPGCVLDTSIQNNTDVCLKKDPNRDYGLDNSIEASSNPVTYLVSAAQLNAGSGTLSSLEIVSYKATGTSKAERTYQVNQRIF